MRILVVSSKYPPEYAGSGLRAHNTYKRLARKYGVQFDVVTGSIEYNQITGYTLEDVKVKRIARKSVRPYQRRKTTNIVQRLTQAIRYRRDWHRNYWPEAIPMFHFLKNNAHLYDVIHTFGHATPTSAALAFAKMTSKPIIIELVNLMADPHQYESKVLSWYYGKGFPKQAQIVCLSNKLKQLCLQHGYLDQNIWCRPNPVDETRFSYEPNPRNRSTLEFPGLRSTDIRILHLAKFRPLKNQLFTIEVLARLPEHYKLILAGPIAESGPIATQDHAYFQKIQNAIKELRLESRVHIIPSFIEDPENYMKATDLFVMPSTSEALGTPSLEALACGVPVITSDIPGVFDQWVKNGQNGHICPLDHQVWADTIPKIAKISRDQMQQASKTILNWASTEAIDAEYFSRLTKLSQPS